MHKEVEQQIDISPSLSSTESKIKIKYALGESAQKLGLGIADRLLPVHVSSPSLPCREVAVRRKSWARSG